MRLEELEQAYNLGKLDKQSYIQQMYSIHDKLFEYSEFIKNRDVEKIEISEKGVEITSKELGIKVLCKRKDQRTAPVEILNFGFYEKKDSDMILSLIQDNSVFFDIGANIGWYSIAAAKVKKNITIHTFEPIKQTYDCLLENIKINQCEQIETYNLGLSNIEDELTFYFYDEGSGNASSALLDETRENQKHTCKVKPLDSFFPKLNLKNLDFIKCDVEGAELLVFKGGVQTIEQYKPIVFTEILRKWTAKFNYDPNEIITFFKDLGYGCYYAQDNNLKEFMEMDEDTVETNFFFLHKTKHAQLIQERVSKTLT
ncbi:Methyltransferase FkbM [Lentisphaera araneosa HTCC2155]|uniref:Methyltransferase FkbM n=1 Tax=Lentisphaera araneosa HTCC2155 TaxID=313628 RepID=A6DT15_9BACT|nr:FkbM family methyltransferase [Lentisphaera araneosa]EDM25190.1 Methyltransferase FkbM [Lentisphaera araneosa HTCC2155]